MKKTKNDVIIDIEAEASEVEVEAAPKYEIANIPDESEGDVSPAKQPTFLKKNICANCGNPSMMKRFCFKCRQKIPSGFSMSNDDDTIKAEIKRNESAKAEFKKTTGLGALSLDTERFMFHIDNSYYYAHELEGFSFYHSDPKVTQNSMGVIKVTADVYFTFTPIGQQRRVRKIASGLHCKYTRSATSVSIEPPMQLLTINSAFNQMLNDELDALKREISFQTAVNEAARSKTIR